MLLLRPYSSTHGWHRYRMPPPALPSLAVPLAWYNIRFVPLAWWARARSSNEASNRSSSLGLRRSARTTRLKKHWAKRCGLRPSISGSSK
eukprot:scaffold9659_cov65-Phaeocystis_antarctica.AAC.1